MAERADWPRNVVLWAGDARMTEREAEAWCRAWGGEDGVLSLSAPDTTAADLMRPVLTLEAATPIYAALSIMRESRSHLALVEDGNGLLGLVTLQDMLDRLLLLDSAA